MTHPHDEDPAPGHRRRVPGERRRAATAPTPRKPAPRGRSRRGSRVAGRGRRRVLLAGLVAAVTLGLLAVPALREQVAAEDVPGKVRVQPESTSAVARWSGQEDDEAFRVELAERPDFVGAETHDVEREEASIETLVPGTTYFVRVRVVDEEGATGSPSQAVRFTTPYTYEPPTVKLGSSVSTQMVARWKAVDADDEDDEVHYETQLSRSKEFEDGRTVEGTRNRVRFKKLEMRTDYWVRTRVVDADGVPLSEWSGAATGQTARIAPLRVATYNVLKSRDKNWAARRTAVAQTILDEKLDVVGLQEATPATVSGGVRQYQDVVRLLGPDWALIEDSKGPTGETRTVYDTTRLTMKDQGYHAITGSTRFGVQRWVTWAVFEQKSTGKDFVFMNTHFATGKGGSRSAHRTQAAAQLTAVADQVTKGGDLPVVIGGDFNSAAERTSANGVYRTITGAGYIDPLVPSDALGSAEERINADLKTATKYSRRPPRDASAPMIDHLFVSPMRVKEWEVVANLDGAGRYVGTIPSDHNMIRATVYLP